MITGILHRVDGPAIQPKEIYSKHFVGDELYYLNGRSMSREQWFEQLNFEQKRRAVWNLE